MMRRNSIGSTRLYRVTNSFATRLIISVRKFINHFFVFFSIASNIQRRLKMSNILLIGGSGRIGSVVTRRLVDVGVKPVIFDLYPKTELIKKISSDIKIVKGDITNIAQVMRALKENEIENIIHLVWIEMMDANGKTDLSATYSVNVGGFINVLEAARIMDVKSLVFCSSKAIYVPEGEYAYPTYKPIPEENANPKRYYLRKGGRLNTYGAIKYINEYLGLGYNQHYDLDFKACRFGEPYGAGIPKPILYTLLENAMLGIPTDIPDGGDTNEDFTYYRDIAQGLIKACYAKNPPSRIYNIATGKGSTIRDWAKILTSIYPQWQIKIGSGIEGIELTGDVLDITRARKELGYEPQYDLEAGIKDWIDSYKRLDLKPSPHTWKKKTVWENI